MKNVWIGWLIVAMMVVVSVAWVWFLSRAVVYLLGLVGVPIPMWVVFGLLMLFDFVVGALFIGKK